MDNALEEPALNGGLPELQRLTIKEPLDRVSDLLMSAVRVLSVRNSPAWKNKLRRIANEQPGTLSGRVAAKN